MDDEVRKNNPYTSMKNVERFRPLADTWQDLRYAFRTLGVQPELGRDFAEVDEPENSVIVSHALWIRQFDGDQTVIGKKITFGISSGDAYVIVGVLPAEINFPARVDVFTMTEITHEDLDRGGSHNWRTIGRLKPGVS